jgi:hypothetical protein
VGERQLVVFIGAGCNWQNLQACRVLGPKTSYGRTGSSFFSSDLSCENFCTRKTGETEVLDPGLAASLLEVNCFQHPNLRQRNLTAYLDKLFGRLSTGPSPRPKVLAPRAHSLQSETGDLLRADYLEGPCGIDA